MLITRSRITLLKNTLS